MTESIEGDAGDLVEMRVAAGRTVSVSSPWRMEKQVSGTANGPETTWVRIPLVGAKHDYGPGEIVSISREEAVRLHGLGYVKFPDEAGDSRPRPNGDAFITGDNGPGLVQTAIR